MIMNSKQQFEQVCFIGLGLIGASFAQAIKNKQLAERLVAVDMHEQSLTDACDDGLISQGSTQLLEVVKGSDLLVICVPIKAVEQVLYDIKKAIEFGLVSENCLITDVSSTKSSIINYANKVFDNNLPSGFVPAHPIAGAENSGYHSRNAKLFFNRNVILCQTPASSEIAISKLSKLWQSVGATIMHMSVEQHDKVFAYTSHLPHLLAIGLVDQLAGHNDNMDIFRYAASGFRDFTRIAASDPTMWHDIFMENETEVITALDEYIEKLAEIRQLITEKKSVELIGTIARSRHARRHFDHILSATPYTKNDAHNYSKNHAKYNIKNNANNDANHTENNTEITDMTSTYTLTPSKHINGTIKVAGDKSISHRSIMFGSLANGITRVSGFLEGEDAMATLQAFRDMGVTIEGPKNGEVIIHGVGMQGLKPSPQALYMGNSGTSMRLLAGILTAQKFDSVMTGDISLSKRPMERVAKPLRTMGAKLQTTGEKGTAPISITGNQSLQGVEYSMPVASAQIKSCLLLAALWAKGKTTIVEPEVCRDHTERMLTAFGYPVSVNGNTITLEGGFEMTACDIEVPSDISSAAFFMVAASIANTGSELMLSQVGMNPTRTGVIDILKLMGADITLSNATKVGDEPVADVTIRAAQLQGIHIPEHLVPLAIDEFPVLFVAASCATGQTVLTGAKELRVKESDRIAVMADGLTTLGIECTVTEDGIIIEGKGRAIATTGDQVNEHSIFTGGHILSHHDHRIAMSFTVASLRASDNITIEGTETISTSFPNFAQLANKVGLKVTEETL